MTDINNLGMEIQIFFLNLLTKLVHKLYGEGSSIRFYEHFQ